MEIKYEKVWFSYNEKTTVLRSINTTLKNGKINGIIGKSGSGKTTMVELINSILVPTKGKVIVDDYIINKKLRIKNINSLRKNIGLIFQYPEEQFFNSTVKKEIEFGLLNFKGKINDIDKRVKDALLLVGLDESYLDLNPQNLSSGEKRKVAIASILVFNPKVIIFDEPTIGLDNKSKENLIKIFRLMKNRYNKTIIVITHDVDMLHKIADNIIVLDKGEIVLEGNKYEVFSNIDALNELDIKMPKIMEFSYKALINKGIKMGYRDDINDLMKDIYRYVK